uniref:Predicted protein n=1 Tax=Hordeum vulgare subsp. vulgare TaxID=112509 RepID=F2EGT4_HORVV|nr:predicted protein [Hordeum vulgare subsp. vulgare]
MPPSRTTTRLSTRSNPVRAARPVKYDKDHLPRLLRPHPKDLEDLLNGDFKIPALVESSYITQALESSRLLFKSTEVLKCRPPPPYFGPNVPKQESTKKGKVICAPHEEELMRLENIIRPYQKGILPPLIEPARGVYLSRLDQALSEYRQLVMDIILSSASQQSDPPTTFKLQDSVPSRVGNAFWVSPLRSRVESKTVVSEDGMPALLCLVDNEPLAALKRIRDKPKNVIDTLIFEMSSQMPERLAGGCSTFQGLVFNGFTASLIFMRVDKPKDIFKWHSTAVATTSYPVVPCRPTFIAEMSELLRGHRDYRTLFRFSKQFQEYDKMKGAFSDVKPKEPKSFN